MAFLAVSIQYVCARDFNVADFGADGKSETIADAQIQKAIDECSKSGGGEVRIGNGLYNCNCIRLKDGVMLNLDRNAVLKMTPIDGKKPTALILADKVKNAGIKGFGTLDGNGTLYERKDNFPGRPYVLFVKDSENFSVENVHMKNSATWTFRIFRSQYVFVRGIKIYAHTNWNNDGIDIDGKNVVVSDCIIDCDDDAVCLKSDDDKFVVENVSITNCIIASNCNPIKFGTASRAGFKNIAISNCVIRAASESNIRNWNSLSWMERYCVAKPITGLAGIALEAVDGGFLENVTISNIVMTDIQTPIFIRAGHRNKDDKRSFIKNVVIRGITATAQSQISSSITGVEGGRVENVSISDCVFNLLDGGPSSDGTEKVPEEVGSYPENRMFRTCLPSYGMYVRHADNITLRNIQFLTSPGKPSRPSVVSDDVSGLRIIDCVYETPTFEIACQNVQKSGNILLGK